MNEKYDVIILGTGFEECILSGLLSVSGKKILHIDKNDYYGGESASLNLHQLWNKTLPKGQQPIEEKDIPTKFGRMRNYNIDMCPKFIMACGELVKILLHTKVTRYLDFKQVGGSFVYKKGKIHKIPATPMETATTSIMGLFQKGYFTKFLKFITTYDETKKETTQGFDVKITPMCDIFKHFGCDENTQDLVGHALALYQNDKYLKWPAGPTMERCKLYAYSLSRYGLSPYIYPLYGLGGLPEGFSRLAAIHGSTYMLNKPIEKILYDDNGKVTGIQSEGEQAQCDLLISSPDYFYGTEKIKKINQVARWIFLLNHPIPDTKGIDSCQIILSQNQIGRSHDIYISCVSDAHQVSNKGYWIAMVSSIIETKNPKQELMTAVNLLGPYEKDFFFTTDRFAPTSKGKNDNVFITTSLDSSTHFESATAEVLDMYKRITGKEFDLSISAEPEDLEEGK